MRKTTSLPYPTSPAEIRAPAGTTYGVSGFQLHFGSVNIRTPGDEVDLLVAMNPAALKVNLDRVRRGGAIMVNVNAFSSKDLKLASYDANPLEDASLKDYQVFEVELTKMTREALKDSGLDRKMIDRSKNMFALGLALWLYSRPMEPTIEWLSGKFARKPAILDANIHLLKKGYHFGETTEDFIVRYEVQPAQLEPGLYRAIRGAEAIAMGLVAASQQSGVRQVARARLERAQHPRLGDGADDGGPVFTQVRLAADERHLTRTQPSQLPDNLQAFLGRQFIGTLLASPRPAVPTLEITGQGDFPDRMNGPVEAHILGR